MCLGGLEWVVLGNGTSGVEFLCKYGLVWVEMDTLCKIVCIYINVGLALRAGPQKFKITHSHHKILSKLIEICWR